ncbi:SprT-like domain-containing protein [bacterium]|nr:SprT-like domain-containing protein [bacterium]
MNSLIHSSGNVQQLELFAPQTLQASNYDLRRLFEFLNRKYWQGRLPCFRCEWSNRMITTWGACYRGRQLIRISSIFKDRPMDEILALLSHEMIHIRYAGHGKRFRQELKRIGLEGDVQRHFPDLVKRTHSLRRDFRYTYACSRCGIRIRRRRRIHGNCAACHERGIRSKFRLI